MDTNWLVAAPAIVLVVTASLGVILGVGFKSTRPVGFLSVVGALLALFVNASLFGRA